MSSSSPTSSSSYRIMAVSSFFIFFAVVEVLICSWLWLAVSIDVLSWSAIFLFMRPVRIPWVRNSWGTLNSRNSEKTWVYHVLRSLGNLRINGTLIVEGTVIFTPTPDGLLELIKFQEFRESLKIQLFVELSSCRDLFSSTFSKSS